MNPLVIIPFYVPYNSEPLSDHGKKLLVAIFSIVNLLWLLSWVISLIRYKFFNSKSYPDSLFEIRWGNDSVFSLPVFDLFMGVIWVIVLLILDGEYLMSVTHL